MQSVLCLLVLTSALSVTPSHHAVQTELWLSHLTRFAVEHPGLTTEQQSIVAEGRDLLSAGILGRVHSPDTREADEARRTLVSFKARASSAFPKALYTEAFVRLLRPEVPGKAIAMIPNCDCNPSTGDCGGECVTGACRVQPDGCGLFGTDLCYGLCS